MWRYLAGAAAALLLVAGGMFLFKGDAAPEVVRVPPVRAAAVEDEVLPDVVPAASERTREQKRFDRYDKDRSDAITREEYLASRKKAFAKLDGNGDGRLSFDEWAVKTTAKFAGADKDRSGSLTRAEFTTTAAKRKAKAAPKSPACRCEPAKAAADDE